MSSDRNWQRWDERLRLNVIGGAALANPGSNPVHSTLAGWELVKRHITLRDDQDAFADGDIWPAPGKSDSL